MHNEALSIGESPQTSLSKSAELETPLISNKAVIQVAQQILKKESLGTELLGTELSSTDLSHSYVADRLYKYRKDIAHAKIIPGAINTKEELAKYISQKYKNKDDLLDFIYRTSEKLFLSEKVKLKGLHDDTLKLLRAITPEINIIKASRYADKLQLMKILDNLDFKLTEYVKKNSDKDGSEESKANATKISGANYWALNGQHKEIARLIKHIEKDVFKEISPKLFKYFTEKSIILIKGGSELSKQEKEELKTLVKLNLLSVTKIKGSGKIYTYNYGVLNAEDFEKSTPKLLREELGNIIHEELNKKYSGKRRPLGTAELHSSGVPTLLDRARIINIANEVKVDVGLVITALKYLESKKLLFVEDGGYNLTELGNALGLGFKSIRLAQRFNDERQNPVTSLFKDYVNRSLELHKSWSVPSYNFKTTHGGLPRTFIMDRWLIPNARFSNDTYEYVKSALCDEKENLLILGNMLQGLPEIDKEQMRTTVDGLEELNEQFAILKELCEDFNTPTINILGPNLDKSANKRAFDQVLRESKALSHKKSNQEDSGQSKVDEKTVRSYRKSKNDQYQYTLEREFAIERKYWAEFMNRIVIPFEIKLGRTLWESNEIYQRTKIDMNELEILRDICGLITKSGSLKEALPEIEENYNDFLKVAKLLDKNYLEKLEKVIFSSKESLTNSDIVSRAGAQIQMIRKDDNVEGLKVSIIPNMNYGKSIRTNPTTGMIGYLKSCANRGDKGMADINFVLNSAEPWISITGTGKWVISSGTMEHINSEQMDLFYTQAQDHIKKKISMTGKPPETGALIVSGGVDNGVVTHALKFEFITPKLLKVLEDNQKRNLPQKTVKIYSTSDWQIGSPTMKDKMAIVNLLLAIKDGASEVLMNGDIQQGMNYMRYAVEAQLVKNPLIGVEDQTQYIIEMMNLVTEYIGKKYETDPNFNLPKFRINIGNHEANTQANKGLQGNWLLSFLEEKLTSYYQGILKNRSEAESYIQYPKKYVSHDGTPVDYSLSILDYSQDTGFRIEASHYDGVGGKGSSFSPPIKSAAQAVHSLELQEPHIIMRAHYHTPSWTTVNGIVCGIFGANAGQSGFERHLGYTDAQPSNGMIELHSDKVPTFMQMTEKYVELREAEMLSELHSLGIMKDYSSFEEFCLSKRARVSSRERGSTNFKTMPLGFPHQAEDANRSLMH